MSTVNITIQEAGTGDVIAVTVFDAGTPGVGGGSTNLSVSATTTTVVVASDTGTDATIAAASGSAAGVMTAAQFTKLDGIAAGATANDTDANLRARSSHTGTQAWSTISSTPNTLSGYGITDGITSAAVAAGYQPLDSDLTAIAALTTTSFGRSLLTQADAAATRTTIGAGTSSFDGAYNSLSGIPSEFTPASHAHGNITNAGAIGSTASLPVITGASGILTVGSFGTTAGTFCQGNDSRLSDARTPVAHSTDLLTSGTLPVARGGTGLTAVGSALQVLRTNAGGTALEFATVTSGVGGSTGSTDNRLLRSDGTGGSTLQSTGITVDDSNNVSGVGTFTASGFLFSSGNGVYFGDSAFSSRSYNFGIGSGVGLVVQDAATQISFINPAFSIQTQFFYPSTDTWEQRRGTSAQTHSIYGTFTNTSNYRRLRFSSTTAGAFAITAEGLGTGASGNTLTIGPIIATTNLTASGLITLGTYTVGTLPSASANTRAIAFVTDSNLAFNSTNLGSTVTAGGSNLVPVFSNGTNWVIG